MGVWCCCSCVSAYCVIVSVNLLICVFGFVAIAGSSYSIGTYNNAEDNFFSKQAYSLVLAGGLMTFVVGGLAIFAGRDPKLRPNYLFCYWCIMSLILVVNLAGFYYFRTFILSIQHTATTTKGKVLSIVQTEVAKEFQDYVLSTYTVCCTGCDGNIPELNCKPGGEVQIVDNCPTVARRNSSSDPSCVFSEPCAFEDLADGSHGLGHGCYAAAKEIPGFNVGSDTCAVLGSLHLDDDPLVGPAANGVSCGGGDPVRYVQNFNNYFHRKYYLIAVPWGFSIALESMAWLAAVYLIMCPYDPTEHDAK